MSCTCRRGALFLVLGLFISTAQAPCQQNPEQSTASSFTMNQRFILDHLLLPGIGHIDASIQRISGASAERRVLPPHPEAAFALGVIYQYRYLRADNRKDAFHSLALLQRSNTAFSSAPLHLVHLGMAYASAARVKRALGIAAIKDMWTAFGAIPDAQADWLIRFLRGTTLAELGLALPDSIFVAGHKRRAISGGRQDLTVVLERNGKDRDGEPLPELITERCRLLLERLEAEKE